MRTKTKISAEIIEMDRQLSRAVELASDSERSAAENRAHTSADCGRFRFEMTGCPHGPQFSLTDYAAAVGVSLKSLRISVDAWASVSDGECAYGGVRHEAAPIEEPITNEQVAKNEKAKRVARSDEIKNEIIEQMAECSGKSPTTVQQNYGPRVTEIRLRLGEIFDLKISTLDQLRPQIARFAIDWWREFKLAETRRATVGKWLAANRGVTVSQVPPSEVEKMYQRIVHQAERHNWSWKHAEADTREWDRAIHEAERIENELKRKSARAVVDLLQACASLALDTRRNARRIGEALQRIEADRLTITADQMEIAIRDVTLSDGLYQQVLAALAGKSGADDWDRALTALITEETS